MSTIKEPNYVRMTITLPRTMKAALEALVKSNDTDRSKFTRDALREKIRATRRRSN